MREVWPGAVAALHAERMPPEYTLLPLMAAGALAELDRPGHKADAGRGANGRRLLRQALARVRRS
jgi:hypothetical protein